MEKIKAICYIRVSSKKQSEEGSSLEAQEDFLKKYGELNNLSYDHILIDGGKSAFKNPQRRVAFKQLMELVRLGQTEAVVVYSISRFARNTKEFLECMDIMKKNNVRFFSYKENIDTSSPMGTFFTTVMAALAQLESAQTGERIKDVKAQSKENGRTYSAPLYGFDNDKKNHLLVPNKEMELVNEIIGMRPSKSYHQIASDLNSSGVVTKKGRRWHASTVRNICNNSIYAR